MVNIYIWLAPIDSELWSNNWSYWLWKVIIARSASIAWLIEWCRYVCPGLCLVLVFKIDWLTFISGHQSENNQMISDWCPSNSSSGVTADLLVRRADGTNTWSLSLLIKLSIILGHQSVDNQMITDWCPNNSSSGVSANLLVMRAEGTNTWSLSLLIKLSISDLMIIIDFLWSLTWGPHARHVKVGPPEAELAGGEGCCLI